MRIGDFVKYLAPGTNKYYFGFVTYLGTDACFPGYVELWLTCGFSETRGFGGRLSNVTFTSKIARLLYE